MSERHTPQVELSAAAFDELHDAIAALKLVPDRPTDLMKIGPLYVKRKGGKRRG